MAGKDKFGDNNNYMQIEKNGFVKFAGDARPWRSNKIKIDSIKLAGVNDPTWTQYKGGLVMAFSDQAIEGNEEIGYFFVDLRTGYDEGTDIEVCVHWVPEDATVGNVRWKITYSWANLGSAFPAESELAANCAAGGVADILKHHDIGTISGTGKECTGFILCSIRRNSSNAGDTFNGKDAYLTAVEFMSRNDTIGTREKHSK